MAYEYTLNVSQEFFDVSKIKENLPSFVSNLKNYFNKHNDTNLKTQIGKVPSYGQVQKTINRIDYGNIKDQRVFVPPGLTCTYLEYIEALDEAVVINEKLISEVLSPFATWLAIGLANPERLASFRKSGIDKYKPHNTEVVLGKLGKCFTDGSDTVNVPFKSAFLRNNDVKVVYQKVEDLANRSLMIDRKKAMAITNDISNMLGKLIERIEENDENFRLSPVSLDTLADLSHQIARELEFYGVISYQVTSLVVALRNTTDAIANYK